MGAGHHSPGNAADCLAHALQVTDEAARSALKEMEDDWAEFEGRLLGKTSTKAPAPPRFSDTQTPSQVTAADHVCASC